MLVSLKQFKRMLPSNDNAEDWYPYALELFKKYKINTPERIAGFMAQCAHESSDFKRLEENLNYSSSRLYEVFGRRYFPSKSAAVSFHRNPKKIANHVYMDKNRSKRGALGNTQPGDGWRFRGRGIKQITGRNNYEAFGKTVGMSAEQAAEYIETKQGAFESACWFWDKNRIAKYADKKDIVGMTKRINGGTNGLSDRKKRWIAALEIMGTEQAPEQSPRPKARHSNILKRGSRGAAVKELQKKLNIYPDGNFGIGTEIALKSWQRKNGLVVDGIAGPNTLGALFNK